VNDWNAVHDGDEITFPNALGGDRDGIFRVVGHPLHYTLWMFSRKWDAGSTSGSGNGDKKVVLFFMSV